MLVKPFGKKLGDGVFYYAIYLLAIIFRCVAYKQIHKRLGYAFLKGHSHVLTETGFEYGFFQGSVI